MLDSFLDSLGVDSSGDEVGGIGFEDASEYEVIVGHNRGGGEGVFQRNEIMVGGGVPN